MINIAEILKDCPKGTKLYSPICGNCKLLKIYNGLGLDVINDADEVFNFSYDGRYNLNGECCIFPSKEKRDWNTFRPFKVGDKIVKKDNPTKCWYVQGIDTYHNSDYYYIVTKGEVADLHFKNQDEWELAPVPKFIVGDIVKSNRNTLFDYKIIKITDTHYTLESIPDRNTYDILICEDENLKLVPKKFDVSKLKAYDKVLVRDTDEQVWVADLFSHVLNRPLGGYTFACVGHYPNQCIPYLGNEHLLGKCDDCDEYYKNW